MLKFDFTNLMSDTIGEKNGLSHADIEALSNATGAAHNRLQQWRESQDAIFYDVVFDNKLLDGIAEAAREISNRFENLVVLGIGGSALGLRCAAGALLPPFWNIMSSRARSGSPRLFVCDNIDPETIGGLLDMLDIPGTCFAVISKSGQTTETAAQFFLVMERLRKYLGERWRENVVIITDPERGQLRPLVKSEGLRSFAIHPKLGGRFSVLSPVGLFPAACVGIDVEKMVNGARSMAERCSSASLSDNPAYQIGGFHHALDTRKKKFISVMIPYSDALCLASDWYSQLWAESLGKNGLGQTPVKALGATDQHSQVQLYMEGPEDKVFTFLGVESFRKSKDSTRIQGASDAFNYLEGKDLGTILRAEQAATTKAIASAGRPNLTVTFPTIDAQHLGEFFMLYEIATAFTGALYGINPFDQPGVELGKKLTKEILISTCASHPR